MGRLVTNDSRTILLSGDMWMSYRAEQAKSLDAAADMWRAMAREARSSGERDECLSFATFYEQSARIVEQRSPEKLH